MLDSSTLKHIWLAIEQTQASVLLDRSDNELIRQIQQKLESQMVLSDSQLNAASNYLRTRIPLIRDIAESRLCTT